MAGNSTRKRKSAGTHKPNPNGARSVVSIRQIQMEQVEEAATLKAIPGLALEALRQGTASEGHWQTLQTRIMVGLEIAKDKYGKETVNALENVLRVVNGISERKIHQYTISIEEGDTIAAGLEATDEMQDTLNTKQLLHYFLLVKKHCKKLDKGTRL